MVFKPRADAFLGLVVVRRGVDMVDAMFQAPVECTVGIVLLKGPKGGRPENNPGAFVSCSSKRIFFMMRPLF
jgi:hypothetical protein